MSRTVDFRISAAVPEETGVTRRDPSPVIRAGDLYHVWYSRSTTDHSGYTATVWHATSPDGHAWTEREEAIPRGPQGAFDEHAVFTPTTLVTPDAYYLFYTAVPEPFTNDGGGPGGTRTAIGLAVADGPDGPWRRLSDQPVLRPSDNPDDFDSMRIDDACLVVREGAFWMYYKGRQQGRTPGQTKMGLAIADRPEGPYVKHPGNPLVDGGHEVCCWPHGEGVGALFCNVGPAGNSYRTAADGLHFEKVADCVPPKAPGPYREDQYRDGPGPGIGWGIAMVETEWPYLVRFDCDLRPAAAADAE